jgi:hypothetical protein
MKGLLRESGCPDPIQRQLLGHGAKSVADSYGQGYSLTVLRDHLRKALALLDQLDGFVPPETPRRLFRLPIAKEGSRDEFVPSAPAAAF